MRGRDDGEGQKEEAVELTRRTTACTGRNAMRIFTVLLVHVLIAKLGESGLNGAVPIRLECEGC